jgi:hypothetical protein
LQCCNDLGSWQDTSVLSSMMFLTLGRIAAMMLITQLGSAPAGEAARQEGEARQLQAEPTRTGKERLGGKASDEQRVDNCKVPLDLRGSTPRPDDCGDAASTAPRRR